MREHNFSVNNFLGHGIKITYEDPVSIKGMHLMTSTKVGRFTYFRGGRIGSLSSIGRFCSVAPDVVIGEGNHPTDWLSTHPFQFGVSGIFGDHEEIKNLNYKIERSTELIKSAPYIGNDVWIGARVTVLRGVHIGDGAIIGTGSVVNRDVEPYEIVAGVPIRHIRYRFDLEIVKKLLSLKWWNYEISGMNGVRFDNIGSAISEIERRIEVGSLKRYEGKSLYYSTANA